MTITLIIFLINEIVKYVCLLSAQWEIRSNGADTLSDKASPQEFEVLDELLAHVELKNSARGSSQVFMQECLEHDEIGLSSIFDKVLTDDIKQLNPVIVGDGAVVRYDPAIARASSRESLGERRLSRTSSMDSIAALDKG